MLKIKQMYKLNTKRQDGAIFGCFNPLCPETTKLGYNTVDIEHVGGFLFGCRCQYYTGIV